MFPPCLKSAHVNLSLYLIANRPSFPNESLFLSKISSAVKGGVTCVQLRDHQNNISQTIQTATLLKKILGKIPLFINTPHATTVMHAVRAEGIFLEECLSNEKLSCNALIGRSVRTVEELKKLDVQNTAYISIKVAPSKKTCPRNDQIWGLKGLRDVRSQTDHRIVAVGGLDVSSVSSIYRELTESDGIAMAGGLMDAENPELTAHKILSIFHTIREKR